jgi:hypothetical protein
LEGQVMVGFWAGLQQWQTLVGAMVAIGAAIIAFANTTRTLRKTKQLEYDRRNRRHSALRAMLPLALAKVSDYAQQSAYALNELVNRCDTNEALPAGRISRSFIQPLPSDTLKALADFIEYSDRIDSSIIESTVAWIQIHDSRLHDLLKRNSEAGGVVRSHLESRIIDAAAIYAGAGAVYDYARRRQTELPHTITWEAVRAALRNMNFWDEKFPQLYDDVQRRERLSAGPFEKLNP